jgi:hypothetical protein
MPFFSSSSFVQDFRIDTDNANGSAISVGIHHFDFDILAEYQS